MICSLFKELVSDRKLKTTYFMRWSFHCRLIVPTKQNVAFFHLPIPRFLTHVSQTHAPFLDSNRGRKSGKLHHRKSLTVVF